MTPQEIIKWLNICATDCHAEECKQCPYNKDDYEAGCGKLLADAALLLSAAYGGSVTVEFTADPVQLSQMTKSDLRTATISGRR